MTFPARRFPEDFRPAVTWEPPPTETPPFDPFPEIHGDWDAIRTTPVVDPTAWIAPGAVVYGRVQVAARSSVWFGCIVRGDHEWIEIGEDSNVQDGSILHVDPGVPCILGKRVTLGHRATVHASVVEDDALIGMSATVLSRCVIGAGALIAAGAVVMEGTIVPPGTLWAGWPARQIKPVTVEQQARMTRTWQHYVKNALYHRAVFGRNAWET